MVDPINYSAMLTQLDLRPLQQGLALRANNRLAEQAATERREDRQLAQAKLTAEQEENEEYLAYLRDFLIAPTPEKLLSGTARFPSHAKALSEGFQTYTTAQQRDIIGTTTNALAALGAGKTEVAAGEIRARRDALRRAGVNTDHTDAALKLIESGDAAQVTQGKAYLAQVLAGAIGGEDASRILKQFGYGAEADAARLKADREERRLDLDERRVTNTERATTAAIAGRARDDARADRKAAGGGGKGGGKAKLPAGFILD